METKDLQVSNGNEVVGFGTTANSFEILQRQAKMLASSSLVPEPYSFFDKNGNLKPENQRGFATANAAIALELSARLHASPIMVAQNLNIIYGRPSWSSQFIIAAINTSGKFSPLRYDITGDGDKKTCVAWATEIRTDARLDSPPVSIEMAKSEGWYGKNGSKWKTMPELMLRYRSATLFGRLYAPELLMGISSREEVEDFVDVESMPLDDANSKTIDLGDPIAVSATTTQEVPHVDVKTGEISETKDPVKNENGSLPKRMF